MSRSFFIALCLFGFCLFAMGQTADTTWYTKKWKPCLKQEAKYFRLVNQTNGLYEIRDFYLNGKLQMKGKAISMEPEVLHDSCTYYYANGKIDATGSYNNGKKVGIWKYYSSIGQLLETTDYSFVLNKDSVRRADSIRRIKAKIPVSSVDKNFSIALRGKLFGFVIIEDNYFSTFTLGTEFLMKGRHSLGLDFTFFGWQNEHDNTGDTALYETYERRTYAYVDYKYRFLSYKIFDFYINLYDKMGTYHMWHEGVSEGYNFWEKPSLSDKVDGTFNQVGAGLGLKCYIGNRFYVDVSANGGKLFSKNNTLTYDKDKDGSDVQYNVKTNQDIFYMRLNLGYKLYMKKKEPSFYTD